MSDINKYIFAIGGGGFTHRKDKSLDNFILSIKNKETLKTPLEAYEYEKEIIREKTEINIILNKFFIIIISFQINIIFIYK